MDSEKKQINKSPFMFYGTGHLCVFCELMLGCMSGERKKVEMLLFMLKECVRKHLNIKEDMKVFAKSIKSRSLSADLTEIEFQWKTVHTLILVLLFFRKCFMLRKFNGSLVLK